MAEAPQKLVQRGYDEIAETYLAWATQKETPRPQQLNRLFRTLGGAAPSARVLELGCGAGVPGTEMIAAACGRVIANDISAAQVRLAQERMATATADKVEFVHGDMTELRFGAGSFEAVVALYSIFHLGQDDQRAMFARVHGWLAPGGLLLCNLGTADDGAGSVDSWLGTQMYWSQSSPEGNVRMVTEAGFEVVENDIIEEEEDGRIIPFQWILARKATG